METLVKGYIAAWNETNAVVRRQLVEEIYANDSTYVDPMASVRGLDEITDLIGAVQGQFPGFVFTLIGAVDSHHRQARFSWGLGPAGTEPVVVGFDVAVTDDDGRLESVFGFLDRVPG